MQRYTIIDLTLPEWRYSEGSEGQAINNAGDVAGTVHLYRSPHAFTYSQGKVTDIGAGLPITSTASGINDAGQVAGTFYSSNGNIPLHAFRYTNGVFTDLGTFGGLSSFGNAINKSGTVVGSANVPGDPPETQKSHAFLYDGIMHDFLREQSDATGINDSGQIVGNSSLGAYIYSQGTQKALGTLFAGGISYPTAINSRGQVTGHGTINSNFDEHAFLYSDGAMKDLGTLPGSSLSYGLGLNNFGQVVGYSPSVTTLAAPFIYTSTRGMVNLNTLLPPNSGWTLFRAEAINDRGQITGKGMHNGEFTGFLITPAP